MKITKLVAQEVANKICQPHIEKNNALRAEIEKLANEYALKLVPLAVRNAFKSNPEYFLQRRSLYVALHANIQLNCPSNSYNQMKVEELEKQDAIKIQKMLDQFDQKHKEINKNREEIQLAIQSFGTIAKLEAGFKEAFDLLPEWFLQSTSTLPVKNIDHLKSFIKQKVS